MQLRWEERSEFAIDLEDKSLGRPCLINCWIKFKDEVIKNWSPWLILEWKVSWRAVYLFLESDCNGFFKTVYIPEVESTEFTLLLLSLKILLKGFLAFQFKHGLTVNYAPHDCVADTMLDTRETKADKTQFSSLGVPNIAGTHTCTRTHVCVHMLANTYTNNNSMWQMLTQRDVQHVMGTRGRNCFLEARCSWEADCGLDVWVIRRLSCRFHGGWKQREKSRQNRKLKKELDKSQKQRGSALWLELPWGSR